MTERRGSDLRRDDNMIERGDGSMARRLQDGTCPRCHAQLKRDEEVLLCEVCELEIKERKKDE
jgi:predicted amidophosphoribosyltransferase